MKMQLIQQNGLFVLNSTYHERHIPKGAGFRWNDRKAPKKWSTNDAEKAIKFRDHADESTKKALDEEIGKLKQDIESSRKSDADIEIPRNAGLEYLPYQKAGIAYCLGKKSAIIGDEMGLGKTIQVLGWINVRRPYRVLVICPKSVRKNWILEAQKWLVHDYQYCEITSKKDEPNGTFVVTNYELVETIKGEFDLVVIDECHKIKNPKAKRTKAILGWYDKKKREKHAGIVDNAVNVLYLTGTPIPNKPIEMWPVLSKARPDIFPSWYTFVKTYCAGVQTRHGWDVTGASNLAGLQNKLRSSLMVRRLKKDVLTELPAKRRQLVVLPANGCSSAIKAENLVWSQHEESLDSLQTDIDLAWASGDDNSYREAVSQLSDAAKMAFTEMSKARHATALAKAPAFIEHARDVIEEVGKVIIFAHHLDVVELIRAGLEDCNPVLLTGPMSGPDRQKSIDRFMTDDSCRVFIGTIGAAGEGITLTVASTVLFAELDWVPAKIVQAEDRAHRIGQKSSVNVQHVVLDGSLDQRIASILLEKQEIADQALDRETDLTFGDRIPVIPTRDRSAQKPAKELKYSDSVIAAATLAIQELACRCDGANTEDGVGFNRYDSRIGKSLASQSLNYTLTDRQTWLALKVSRKYKGQLINYLSENDYAELENEWKNE